MFLDISKFTKQVKNAYNYNNLSIGNINGGLVFNAGSWLCWIDNNHIPNKIKAIVMELAGILPETDKLFSVSKDNSEPQYKIVDDIIIRMLERVKLAQNKLTITPVMLVENYNIRLVQNTLNAIIGIRQDYLDMIDPSQIELDIESAPVGPAYTHSENSGIYWSNAVGMLIIMPIMSKKVEIVRALEAVDFGEDR